MTTMRATYAAARKHVFKWGEVRKTRAFDADPILLSWQPGGRFQWECAWSQECTTEPVIAG